MTIKASNFCVWVVKDKELKEVGGLIIPDTENSTVHRGKIITVGKKCTDPDIKEGRLAIFNKSAGFPISEDGITYTILNELDIVGTTND